MRRFSLLVSLLAVVLIGLVAAGGRSTIAQDAATPAAMAGHPLIGTWIVTDPTGSPSVTAFTADGIMLDTEVGGGGSGVGTWEATGERTAAFTLVIPIADPQFQAVIVIRGTVEIDAAGDTATVPYSITGVGSDGAVVFTDEGQVTAARLPVEPIGAVGTPLAGFPTWNPAAEDEEAPPEATPVG
jgi:hypothetical protein